MDKKSISIRIFTEPANVLSQHPGADFYDAYGSEVQEVTDDLSHITGAIQSSMEALKEEEKKIGNDVDVSYRQERFKALDESALDLQEVVQMLQTLLRSCQDIGSMIQALENADYPEEYILHRKQELVVQNTNFNRIIRDIGDYVTVVWKNIHQELDVLHRLANGEKDDKVAHRERLIAYESSFLYSKPVYTGVKDGMSFVADMMHSIRDDLLKTQVVRTATEVKTEQRSQEALNYQKLINDVHEGEQLDVHYRSQEKNHQPDTAKTKGKVKRSHKKKSSRPVNQKAKSVGTMPSDARHNVFEEEVERAVQGEMMDPQIRNRWTGSRPLLIVVILIILVIIASYYVRF